MAGFSGALVVADAQASGYLGGGEARRAIGRELHGPLISYWVETGSLRASCWRVRSDWVRCIIRFSGTVKAHIDARRVVYGDHWCGPAGVKKRPFGRSSYPKYLVRWNLNRC
jgi:hypothetical protein